MSLLWRKHLRISLCADRVVFAAFARGLRPGKPRGSVLQVQVPPHGEEWRGAVDALPQVLAQHAAHDVSVVIADQFVRYVLLPWNAAFKTDDQWMALARHRLGAVHGAPAADWDVRLTETAPQGPRLACAVDRDLIRALAGNLAPAGARLVSAQPFLVTAFNRIRRRIGNGSCWLVVEEPGRLTLALIQRGIWVAIRSRRSDGRWRQALPEIIERESAFLALPEPCTGMVVCAQGTFDTDMHEAFRTQAVSYGDLALAWEPQ